MNIAKSIERSSEALAMDRVSRTSSRNSTSLPYSYLRTPWMGRKALIWTGEHRYRHSPERTTPFEETCEAMERGFREGEFHLFGISNCTAKEVEEIVLICEKNG